MNERRIIQLEKGCDIQKGSMDGETDVRMEEYCSDGSETCMKGGIDGRI